MNQKGFGSILGLILIIIGAIIAVSYFTGKGSGNVITETRDVVDFNRIVLNGTGNLNITQGETEGLQISAEDNIIGKITTEVNGKTLEIGYTMRWPFWSVWPTEDINFNINVIDLEHITINGSGSAITQGLASDSLEIMVSGSAEIDMAVELNKLSSEINGSGNFTVSGTATEQSLEINGSGKYFAKDLASQKTDIKVSGSGNAELNVSDELDVDISGSGSVKYLGTPKVTQSISGSGSIEQL